MKARLDSKLRALAASEGYRRLLRWAALPVTDRRWAAPLAAIALGFGLFVGVALGPNAAGGVAGVAQIVEEVSPASASTGATEGGGEEAEGEESDPFEEGNFGGEESFEAGGFEEESGFEFAEVGDEESAPFGEETTTPPAEPEEEDEGAEEGKAVPAAGTVAHVNPAAGSYALVETGGTLAAIHAKKLPVAGQRVSVPVRTLANGTFVEAGPRKKTGTKAKTSFSGIVTWVDADPAAPAYSVSKRGVSLLVKVHPDPSGAPPTLPALGAYASVEVAIEPVPATPAPEPPPAPATPAPLCDGQPLAAPAPPKPTANLWQAKLDAAGVPFTYSDFAGIVAAVCPGEGKLYISADDTRAGEADVAFAVPKGINLKKLKPGESVLATAEIGSDGILTLKGLAGDEQTKGADDAKATQGDLVNHNKG